MNGSNGKRPQAAGVGSGSRTGQLRAAAPWAVVGIVLVVGLAIWLRFSVGGPFGLDEWWHGIATASRGTMPYAIAVFFAEIGGGVGAAACSAIAVALLVTMRRGRDAAAVATAMALGVATSEVMKALVMRPRPWDRLYEASGSSFPSGHSLGAAALAVSLALVVAYSQTRTPISAKWAWALACTWILLMMWSRTALHVHWLSDALAGAVLGTCVAILSRRFWFRNAPAVPQAAR